MAAKKTTRKRTTKAKVNSDMVSIFLPYIDGEEDEITVGVNEKLYKVKRGEEVLVPRAVAVVIRNSNLQARVARAYSDSVKNVELF